MTALLGSLAFIIPAGYLIWRWDKKRRYAAKKKAKVIKFDVTESYYDN